MPTYQPHDLEKMIQWSKNTQSFNDEELRQKIDSFQQSTTIKLIHQHQQLVGYIDNTFSEDENLGLCYTIELGLDDSFFELDVIESLLLEQLRFAQASFAKVVDIAVNTHNQKLKALLTKLSFKLWYGYIFMEFKGKPFPKGPLSKRKVVESDFHQLYEAIGLCFAPMRTALDIPPYNIYVQKDKKRTEKQKDFFLKHADQTFLYYDLDQWVGSACLLGGDIDDLLVLPRFQNKGYGQMILQDISNVALHQNINPFIGVTTINQAAYHLYKKNHYQEYLIVDYYRLK